MHAHIVALPGDGIGPEVTDAALEALALVAQRHGHAFQVVEALIGGAAIEATGHPLPNETVALCTNADAVLLGAVGGPQWDDPQAHVRPEQGLLGIRSALGLFANIRPVRPYVPAASPIRPERLNGVDMVFVRELTGGIYFGAKRRTTDDGIESATDECTYTVPEIERVVRVAAELAAKRRGKLTSVDKANVMETSRLWRATTIRVIEREYPFLQLEHLLVDACSMHILQRPADFDVIVTENLFGDVLTDEASVLAGSIGLLPSASLGAPRDDGRRIGLYEPIHGSAPQLTGQDVANPLGAILSAALLLRHSLGLEEEARTIERAVDATLADGYATADITLPGRVPARTTDMVAAVLARIEQGAPMPEAQHG
jgi:3-isopropylmalate dehydrogenase